MSSTDLATKKKAETPATDGWDVEFKPDVTPWSELTLGQKITDVGIKLFKVIVILGALYAFICSLSFLADGFRLVAGKRAGEVFRNSEVFNNPIAGMLVGVLVTVLVQSSSTSTSIIITMVAADLLTVKQAISLVMGANIGTSVTSTIVAMAQIGDKDEFRRAFAAATVHDMFNFLSVIVLLPLESLTHYLYHVSKALIDATPGLQSGQKPPEILNAITKPLTSKLMTVDKKLITQIAVATPAELVALEDKQILKNLFGWGPDDMSDGLSGAIALIFALTILCTTLFTIVYTLKSLLKGRIAVSVVPPLRHIPLPVSSSRCACNGLCAHLLLALASMQIWLHKSVNGNVPDLKLGGLTIPMGWLSGYLALIVGLGVTICVQSSSITTSALTPLVGVGVIKVERMYPTVLGANIGTCITGLLAALAADSSKLFLTLQVAYAHLFFNLTGTSIWYVIWPLRAIPIGAAKFLGDTTAVYRWYALAYIVMCFLVIPLIWMGMAIASTALVVVVSTLVLVVLAFITIINVMQTRCPEKLPAMLQDWTFLPLWMRSLEPLDRVVCSKIPTPKCCKAAPVTAAESTTACAV